MKKIALKFYLILIGFLFTSLTNAQVDAIDDEFNFPDIGTGWAGNVLLNDTLDFSVISNPTDVIISYDFNIYSTWFMITSNGDFIVNSNVPCGIYNLIYTITKTTDPASFDSATIQVVIIGTPMLENDNYTVNAGITSVVGPINGNDFFCTNLVDSGMINVPMLPTGMSYEPSTGEITIDSSVITGTYTFNYYMGLYSALVTINVLPTLSSLSFDELNNIIKVFPNPTNNIINIQSNDIMLNIDIKDMNGRTIQSFSKNSNEVVLNIENLQSGIYILNVKTKSGSYIGKIIKE